MQTRFYISEAFELREVIFFRIQRELSARTYGSKVFPEALHREGRSAALPTRRRRLRPVFGLLKRLYKSTNLQEIMVLSDRGRLGRSLSRSSRESLKSTMSAAQSNLSLGVTRADICARKFAPAVAERRTILPGKALRLYCSAPFVTNFHALSSSCA